MHAWHFYLIHGHGNYLVSVEDKTRMHAWHFYFILVCAKFLVSVEEDKTRLHAWTFVLNPTKTKFATKSPLPCFLKNITRSHERPTHIPTPKAGTIASTPTEE